MVLPNLFRKLNCCMDCVHWPCFFFSPQITVFLYCTEVVGGQSVWMVVAQSPRPETKVHVSHVVKFVLIKGY